MQWSLYIPPGLTFTNSAFCPHSVFTCFVWIWEQTAIISLYSINWLVFITETECVYCAVRTGYLYNSRSSPREICSGRSGTGTGLSPSSSVYRCQYPPITAARCHTCVVLFTAASTLPSLQLAVTLVTFTQCSRSHRQSAGRKNTFTLLFVAKVWN
jgi:hypothetical protein